MISDPLDDYALADRFRRERGRVYLTGTQALVRVLLDQARRDRRVGLETAGFVSGYRGSPLGGVDLELWRAKKLLDDARIEFLPAVNEDLAATAVLGSQQVETNPRRDVRGVFGLWYGKGPGVDRAGDALKHGNAYGSSPHGGVLVVAGDDHGCVSSSMPHQSDVAFMSWFMPTLNPASVAEYLAFGEYGYALSRFSGMWAGFKAVSETVESGASVELAPDRIFAAPDFAAPPGGLHYRWPDLPGPQIEERMEAKKHAVFAFARANPVDRRLYDIPGATYGIVTTGKGHLDLMEALRLLGLDEAACRRIGLDIYKVGMVWPLALHDALEFVTGKREILVVEEKRGIIESQFKEYFYDYPGRKPDRMVGKHDETGARLIPWTGELSPRLLAPVVAARLDAIFSGLDLVSRADRLTPEAGRLISVPGATRTPYFCSGCPHNSSTRVPEGSQALAGIGCHFMASWMDRETTSLIQMGGEGVNWAASSRFTGHGHVFQNLGEGTYHHSGSMAIRQAIAAGANITYKILYNDAVAMTGGQPVDGPISVEAIAHAVRAEGVERIALVSDDPDKFAPSALPGGVTIHHRDELDPVQRELREVSGVSILIYEQACATEKRRRRKRGEMADPARFVVINDLVCEGCGDCSVASNCLSVEPKETPFGRKRRINLSTCNKDYSCLDGFCPSFVTIEGGRRRKRAGIILPPQSNREHRRPDPPPGGGGGRSAGPDRRGIIASEGAMSPPRFAASQRLGPSLQGRDQVAAAIGDPSRGGRGEELPEPPLPALDKPYDLLVTGVGGTGVVTLGALVTMAAHLEGKGASVLDFTGFAQKFGPVLSYIRLADAPEALNQVRIDQGAADALIGCDLVVSSSPKASGTYRRGTRAVVNTAEMPTGDVVRFRDADLASSRRLKAIAGVIGEAGLSTLDANAAAETLLGDTVFANVLMLGAAWQAGLVPVSLAALERAIELNGVAVEVNRQAFAWGRIASADPTAFAAALGQTGEPPQPETLDDVINRRTAFLSEYQNAAYAERYRARIARIQAAEAALGRTDLTDAVARSLFRLMAYKDEYEVARLHARPGFAEEIARDFEGDYRIVHHLAPPLLPSGRDARGRPKKRAFGPWMRRIFPSLASLKRLRGTPFDPFGYAAERRMERELVIWFETLVDAMAGRIGAAPHDELIAIARAPMEMRGFGPVKKEAVARIRPEMERRWAALGHPAEGAPALGAAARAA